MHSTVPTPLLLGSKLRHRPSLDTFNIAPAALPSPSAKHPQRSQNVAVQPLSPLQQGVLQAALTAGVSSQALHGMDWLVEAGGRRWWRAACSQAAEGPSVLSGHCPPYSGGGSRQGALQAAPPDREGTCRVPLPPYRRGRRPVKGSHPPLVPNQVPLSAAIARQSHARPHDLEKQSSPGTVPKPCPPLPAPSALSSSRC